MAKKETSDAELYPIEELCAKLGYPRWALAGAKAAYAWGEGKRLTERDFRQAMDRFLARRAG